MKYSISLVLVSALIVAAGTRGGALAVSGSQKAQASAKAPSSLRSGLTSSRLVDEVRHQLLTLSNYDVFDWLEAEVRPDNTVVLRGEVRRSSTKTDAEQRVTKLEAVGKVTNEIEVLPLSPSDERIRIAMYRAIFNYDSPLFQYATHAIPPIHIVVNNGRATLKGNVASNEDRQLAYMAALSVSGVFEVKNELMVGDR